ncbi:MAG: hypothetical protein H6815_12770 [Phycisphaeraceae bacterium]|nr:hypothetical protein [Phycisphaerales bacterium]MCB9861315.1 hypothetical protein [Phycisphaeraceae bacterium]
MLSATVFYIIGLCVLGFGAILMVWAVLIGDRARGRVRCPGPAVHGVRRFLLVGPLRRRCWYNMKGLVPNPEHELVCPECGRHVQVHDWKPDSKTKPPRLLRRPRRRWKWASAALAIILLGITTFAWPMVTAKSWVTVAPNLVLIAMFPMSITDQDMIDQTGPRFAIYEELRSRQEQFKLSPFEERVLLWRMNPLLNPNSDKFLTQRYVVKIAELAGIKHSSTHRRIATLLSARVDEYLPYSGTPDRPTQGVLDPFYQRDYLIASLIGYTLKKKDVDLFEADILRLSNSLVSYFDTDSQPIPARRNGAFEHPLSGWLVSALIRMNTEASVDAMLRVSELEPKMPAWFISPFNLASWIATVDNSRLVTAACDLAYDERTNDVARYMIALGLSRYRSKEAINAMCDLLTDTAARYTSNPSAMQSGYHAVVACCCTSLALNGIPHERKLHVMIALETLKLDEATLNRDDLSRARTERRMGNDFSSRAALLLYRSMEKGPEVVLEKAREELRDFPDEVDLSILLVVLGSDAEPLKPEILRSIQDGRDSSTMLRSVLTEALFGHDNNTARSLSKMADNLEARGLFSRANSLRQWATRVRGFVD